MDLEILIKVGQFITAIASLIFVPLIKMILSLNSRMYDMEKQYTRLENEINHLIKDIHDLKYIIKTVLDLNSKVHELERQYTRLEERLENEIGHLIKDTHHGKRNH